jgi:glutamate/tyrosine decarboxylase-like PLP-dependent enzyme
LIGFPPSAGGLFVSGGSIANLTALAVARDSKPGVETGSQVIYRTDQTHSSVDRALKILGYGEDQIREVGTDERLRLDTADLLGQVAADRRGGRTPHIVVGNAGTTNTGAIDPVAELAEICRTEDMWLHVDGAYGAAAAISERGAKLLEGIEAADSITLDPHKWLFQPYAIGCVLLRDARKLRDFFHVMPEYLQDAEPERGEINPCDYGPELTRSFRALKLWMSLKVFGADAFARAIDHGLGLAEATEKMLRGEDCWEIVSPAQLAIVCFRYTRSGLSDQSIDEVNTEIAHRTSEDGCCFLSTTRLQGRPVLRMCTIQPSTTEADLRLTIDCLRGYAERLVS